jgi:CRP/FNR family transcriptional regulator, cyclic AMP receptor protein
MNERSLVLSHTIIFASASDRTRHELGRDARMRELGRGDFVFHEGDPGDEIYVVVDGLVKLARTSRDGAEVAFGTVGRRGSFGELSALDEHPRSASACAVRDSALLVVPGRAVRAAIEHDSELASALMRFLAERLRATTAQHAELVFVDLPGRMARYLLEAAGPSPNGTLDLELNQSDLGALLGASRQSVNQVLRAFESEGVISRRGQRVEVVDRKVLEHRAEGIEG